MKQIHGGGKIMKKHWGYMITVAIITTVSLAAGCGNGAVKIKQEEKENKAAEGTQAAEGAQAAGNNEFDGKWDTKSITVVTGPSGGTQEVVGTATAEIWKNNIDGVEFSAVPSGGTSVNVNLIETDQGEVAMVTGDVIATALEGQEPFKEKYPDLRGMFSTYPNTYQVWVQQNSDIEEFGDLKGKKICYGQPGSGPFQVTLNMMELHGFGEEDVEAQYLDWGSAVSALQDGNLDAVCWTTTYPASKIVDAETAKAFRLLQINTDQLEAYKEKYSGWVDVVIPEDTYKIQPEDVMTIGTPNCFAVRADMDSDLVYEMTKALWENKETLGNTHALLKNISEDTVASGMVAELHPGAEKFYKEIGIIE